MKNIEEYIRLFEENEDKAIEFSEKCKMERPKYSFRNMSIPTSEWTDVSFASGVRYVGSVMIHSSSSYSVNNTFPSSYMSMDTVYNSN